MSEKRLPVTCPLCGKKNEYSLDILIEGSEIQCSACKIKLKLHGHMLKDIQSDIARLMEKD